MPRLEIGEHAPLNVTRKAQHRVFAGLGWEPHEKPGFIERLAELAGLKKSYHDLDLGCLLFDEGKRPIGDISVLAGHMSGDKGHIYHSGDNIIGDRDGEQLSVELLKLDPFIHYILFTASIKSGHTFGEIVSPEIRLADGYSNHNFLQAHLNQNEGRAKSAFAFASIYRTLDNWNIHNISTYLDLPMIQKPNGVVSSLLTKI